MKSLESSKEKEARLAGKPSSPFTVPMTLCHPRRSRRTPSRPLTHFLTSLRTAVAPSEGQHAAVPHSPTLLCCHILYLGARTLLSPPPVPGSPSGSPSLSPALGYKPQKTTTLAHSGRKGLITPSGRKGTGWELGSQ